MSRYWYRRDGIGDRKLNSETAGVDRKKDVKIDDEENDWVKEGDVKFGYMQVLRMKVSVPDFPVTTIRSL